MTTVTALVDQADYAATLAALGDARADAAQWRARYMAAHEVLLYVEDFCEHFLTPQGTIFMDRFFAMRAAFLAYRAKAPAAQAGPATATQQEPTP